MLSASDALAGKERGSGQGRARARDGQPAPRPQTWRSEGSLAAYLLGHAAALAVVLGDELVKEQVDLGARGGALIRAQSAELGAQAAETGVRLRGRLRLRAREQARHLHRRHLARSQGITSGASRGPASSVRICLIWSRSGGS